MNCPRCFREIPAGIKECPHCKAIVNRGKTVLVASPVECEHCRFLNPPASVFCQECGKSLEVRAEVQAKREEIKHKTTEPRQAVVAAPEAVVVPPIQSKERISVQNISNTGGTAILGSIQKHEIQFRLLLLSESREIQDAFQIEDGANVGRQGCVITIPDSLISRTHCKFSRVGDSLFVEDLESKNGTFVRMKKNITLGSGAEIRVGQKFFRIEKTDIPQQSPASNSGETMVAFSFTVSQKPQYKLILLNEEKKVVQEFPLTGTLRVGRQEGEIVISDPFISRHHCEFQETPEGVLITDLDSKNGVFIRLTAPVELKENDELRIGMRLFQIAVGGSSK